MRTKKQNFVRGFIDVLPLLIPVVPFGIIFGAIGIELGFGPYVIYATSIIIFSGASQIVFFQLLSNLFQIFHNHQNLYHNKNRFQLVDLWLILFQDR